VEKAYFCMVCGKTKIKEWKGGIIIENLSEELMEELTVETSFTIPIFGGIAVAESVVATWGIMAVL